VLPSANRVRLKHDCTRAETRFRLSTKRTSLFKSAGASVQSTTSSRGVRISGSNVGYTKFRGSVKGTGYPLHSPLTPSLPLPCVTMCHHVSTAERLTWRTRVQHDWQCNPVKLKYALQIPNFTNCSCLAAAFCDPTPSTAQSAGLPLESVGPNDVTQSSNREAYKAVTDHIKAGTHYPHVT